MYDTRSHFPRFINLDLYWAIGGKSANRRATHSAAAHYDASTGICDAVLFSGIKLKSDSGEQAYDSTTLNLQLKPAVVRKVISCIGLDTLECKSFKNLDSKGWVGVASTRMMQALPSPRNEHGMVADSSGAYLYGGMYITTGTTRASQSIKIFKDIWKLTKTKTAIRTWSKITPKGNGPSPPARYTHASCFIPPSASAESGYLAIYGGRTSKQYSNSWTMLDDVWLFNFHTREWKFLEIKTPHYNRMYHTMALWNNRLVVFGGYKLVQNNFQYPVGYVFKDLLALNLDDLNSQSKQLAWMKDKANYAKKSISVRMSHSAIIEGDSLFFYGGR